MIVKYYFLKTILFFLSAQFFELTLAHSLLTTLSINKLKGIPESRTVEACDETNSVNYFIYCSGKLLEAVNYHSIYEDKKTFVDKPMKKDAKVVFDAFNEQFPEEVADIDPTKLQKFLDDYFYPEHEELDRCELDEWQEKPPQLKRIKDIKLRKFAFKLNEIWKYLCRKIKPEVKKHADRHSLIYVENPFIVPGGRFQEFYYWDAYWIFKGLVVSGLFDTMKYMIKNFVQVVNTVGFVPNGGRVYYLQRSQPPLLIPMVNEYYQATHNTSFIEEILPSLEKELEFWDTNRQIDVTIDGEIHTVYQYRAGSNVPRPESYREDVELTKHMTNKQEKAKIYRNLASAAESGWDFSSRWFEDPAKLISIKTTSIVPVDLNSYICWNFKILSHLFLVTGNYEKAASYDEKYRAFLKTFQTVFYVQNGSGWYDFNVEKNRHNLDVFPTIASPLFTGCYDDFDLKVSDKLLDKMENAGLFKFASGIPASLNNQSKQQWDYPNGWSPINHMIIEGLRKSNNARAQQTAYQLAEKWVLQNYRVFSVTHRMWEKYDVTSLHSTYGSGGEYVSQEGFGWTNGGVLDLMRTYSDRLSIKETPKTFINSSAITHSLISKKLESNVDGSENPRTSITDHFKQYINIVFPKEFEKKNEQMNSSANRKVNFTSYMSLIYLILLCCTYIHCHK